VPCASSFEQIRTNPNKPIIGLLSQIFKDDLLRVSDSIAYMYKHDL
jgi:hypothetical protein